FDGKGPLSGRSIQSYVTTVRIFLNWWCDQRARPRIQVRLPKADRKLVRVLSPAEIERLVDACSGHSITAIRDRAMILLLADTGIRAGELVTIRLADITWNEHTDAEPGEPAGWVFVLGKSRRERQVPFGKRTALHLRHYVETCRPDG